MVVNVYAAGRRADDLAAICGPLERGGFDGWYDLRIFSDEVFEDPRWLRPAAYWVADGKRKFENNLDCSDPSLNRIQLERVIRS
jgi:hypothetical protein